MNAASAIRRRLLPDAESLPIEHPSAITSLTHIPMCCKIDNRVVSMMVKASGSVVKNGEEEDLEKRRRSHWSNARDSYLKVAIDGFDLNDQ
jgi:hypothetical protein